MEDSDHYEYTVGQEGIDIIVQAIISPDLYLILNYYSSKESDGFTRGLPSFIDQTTNVYTNSLSVENTFSVNSKITNEDEGVFNLLIAADTG